MPARIDGLFGNLGAQCLEAGFWLHAPGRHRVRREHRPVLQRIFAPAGDLRLTQPVSHADGRNAPMLLIHGRDDSRVRPGNSLWVAERVRGAGGPAVARIDDHLDHPWAVASLAAPLRWRSDLAGVVGGFARCVTQASTANPPTAVSARHDASRAETRVHSETDCLTARPG